MAFLSIDGGQLFYEEQGGGDPPLVFVHGLACAHEDWRNQVDYFAPSNRVVSLDLRGHGRSEAYTSGFDILSFGADVAALIAALRLPPVVLVGHSMGCRVILECARIAPLQPGDSSTWLELVAELAPRADIAIVPGVGHFTMIEAADAVDRHIAAMLTTIARR